MDGPVLPEPGPVCGSCGRPLADTARFCPGCGAPREAAPASTGQWRDVVRFFWAVGLIIVYILASHAVDDWVDYQRVLAFDAGFLLLVMGVAAVFHKELGPSLIPRSIGPARLLLYVGLQIVLSCFVLYTVPRLNAALGFEDVGSNWIFLGSPAPLLLALLSTAVLPALTEELGFRGILFGQLERLTGSGSAIIVTAIIFAFVHFSMLSMYWLLPAGLLYGWIRAREGHIWLGVLLHMAHNAAVVFTEFAEVGAP